MQRAFNPAVDLGIAPSTGRDPATIPIISDDNELVAGDRWLILSDAPEHLEGRGVMWRCQLIPETPDTLNLRVYIFHEVRPGGVPGYISLLLYNRANDSLSYQANGWRRNGPVDVDRNADMARRYLGGGEARVRGADAVRVSTGGEIFNERWANLDPGVHLSVGNLLHSILDVSLACESGIDATLLVTSTARQVGDHPSGETADFLTDALLPYDAPLDQRTPPHFRGRYRNSDIIKTVQGGQSLVVSTLPRTFLITPSVPVENRSDAVPHRDMPLLPEYEPNMRVQGQADLKLYYNYGNYGVVYRIQLGIQNDNQRARRVYIYVASDKNNGEVYGGAVRLDRATGAASRLHVGAVRRIRVIRYARRNSAMALLEQLDIPAQGSATREYSLLHAGSAGLPVDLVISTDPPQGQLR